MVETQFKIAEGKSGSNFSVFVGGHGGGRLKRGRGGGGGGIW